MLMMWKRRNLRVMRGIILSKNKLLIFIIMKEYVYRPTTPSLMFTYSRKSNIESSIKFTRALKKPSLFVRISS